MMEENRVHLLRDADYASSSRIGARYRIAHHRASAVGSDSTAGGSTSASSTAKQQQHGAASFPYT